MSEWQVGDLALCIKSGTVTREGAIYTVTEIWPVGALRFGFVRNVADVPLLIFAEVICEDGDGSHPSRFRRIRRDRHESCEPEFVALLKSSKPKVST
jgi:hypothetical protein